MNDDLGLIEGIRSAIIIEAIVVLIIFLCFATYTNASAIMAVLQ